MQTDKGPIVMTVGADNLKVEPRSGQDRPVGGPDWVILGGLKAGDKVIVDDLAKARPGARLPHARALAPLVPQAGCRARRRASGEGLRDARMSRFFINRPIFASVISIIIVIAGLDGPRALPVAHPEITPPTVVITATSPRLPPTPWQNRRCPIEQLSKSRAC